MTFPKPTCLTSKYMRKSAFRKISEWGISVSDVEEIRPVHLFQVFPSTFLNHLCVCVCVCIVTSKQANILFQPRIGS